MKVCLKKFFVVLSAFFVIASFSCNNEASLDDNEAPEVVLPGTSGGSDNPDDVFAGKTYKYEDEWGYENYAFEFGDDGILTIKKPATHYDYDENGDIIEKTEYVLSNEFKYSIDNDYLYLALNRGGNYDESTKDCKLYTYSESYDLYKEMTKSVLEEVEEEIKAMYEKLSDEEKKEALASLGLSENATYEDVINKYVISYVGLESAIKELGLSENAACEDVVDKYLEVYKELLMKSLGFSSKTIFKFEATSTSEDEYNLTRYLEKASVLSDLPYDIRVSGDGDYYVYASYTSVSYQKNESSDGVYSHVYYSTNDVSSTSLTLVNDDDETDTISATYEISPQEDLFEAARIEVSFTIDEQNITCSGCYSSGYFPSNNSFTISKVSE